MTLDEADGFAKWNYLSIMQSASPYLTAKQTVEEYDAEIERLNSTGNAVDAMNAQQLKQQRDSYAASLPRLKEQFDTVADDYALLIGGYRSADNNTSETLTNLECVYQYGSDYDAGWSAYSRYDYAANSGLPPEMIVAVAEQDIKDIDAELERIDLAIAWFNNNTAQGPYDFDRMHVPGNVEWKQNLQLNRAKLLRERVYAEDYLATQQPGYAEAAQSAVDELLASNGDGYSPLAWAAAHA